MEDFTIVGYAFSAPWFRCLGRFDTASRVVSVGEILGLLFNESGIFFSDQLPITVITCKLQNNFGGIFL